MQTFEDLSLIDQFELLSDDDQTKIREAFTIEVFKDIDDARNLLFAAIDLDSDRLTTLGLRYDRQWDAHLAVVLAEMPWATKIFENWQMRLMELAER